MFIIRRHRAGCDAADSVCWYCPIPINSIRIKESTSVSISFAVSSWKVRVPSLQHVEKSNWYPYDHPRRSPTANIAHSPRNKLEYRRPSRPNVHSDEIQKLCGMISRVVVSSKIRNCRSSLSWCRDESTRRSARCQNQSEYKRIDASWFRLD